jgi:hypothetical protein
MIVSSSSFVCVCLCGWMVFMDVVFQTSAWKMYMLSCQGNEQATRDDSAQCHTPGDKNPQLCRCENLKTERLKYFNVLYWSVCLNGEVHCNRDVTVIIDEHCSLMCNGVLYTKPFHQLALFPSSAGYHFPDGCCSGYWKMFTIMVLVL